MLAVVRGLKAWRHLLEGTKFNFEVWMDHKNLEYFMKAQKLNQRQARQALYLSRFNFTLKHVPETRIGMADSLSRRLDWKVGVENDNKNQKLIKEEWIRGMMEVVVKVLQQPLVTQEQMISQRAKLSVGLSSKEWGNYKRTRQGALATLLLYIYYYIMVHATTSCPITHPHVFSIRPPCFLHVP